MTFSSQKSVTRVATPQAQVRAAIVRCDITPPVGIYHRMWGAALHDKATGIHRPLTATLLWLASADESRADDQILISMDHCILDTPELVSIREAVAAVTSVAAEHIHVMVTHTHGSGWMSRKRSEFPGGDLIGPYLDSLCDKLAGLAVEAQPQLQPASIVYGAGRCSLAAHRDFFDSERGHAVCGFNPAGSADDAVIVGRITTPSGQMIGTIINYACHPTTLAWDNTLLSPDWIGAMRETVEQQVGGLCFFMQGASGDLGPREGFVGDTAVADRNGRILGYSVLAALEQLAPAGTEYVYSGPTLSGTWIGTWKHVPCSDAEKQSHQQWTWSTIMAELPYRHDLPTITETTAKREHWFAEEEAAKAAGHVDRIRECRANGEQMTRQLARLNALAPGKSCPLPVTLAFIGDAIWVLVPGELYQVFQLVLRQRFASKPVLVATLTGDWQPGYIPPAASFGYGIYQEVIAATSPGSLELLIEDVSRAITSRKTSAS
jgi:hypothetical protein